MAVSTGNTHAAPQTASAAGNISGKGISLKTPVQKNATGGDAESGIESAYINTPGQMAAPFKLPLQLKTGTFFSRPAQAEAVTPVMQCVKLSNGTDTDDFDPDTLEDLANNPEENMLDEGDVETIWGILDGLKKGGKPAGLKFKGAEIEDDDWSDHEFFDFDSIPKSTHQEHVVGGHFYRFWNDAYRCVEFNDPKDKNVMGTITKATPVKIEERVNIKGPGGKIKGIPSEDLKQPKKKNYYHFKAANMEAGFGSAGTSPDGKTWHHHHTEGQMELLDRDVHAAFKHAGGKKYWGSV